MPIRLASPPAQFQDLRQEKDTTLLRCPGMFPEYWVSASKEMLICGARQPHRNPTILVYFVGCVELVNSSCDDCTLTRSAWSIGRIENRTDTYFYYSFKNIIWRLILPVGEVDFSILGLIFLLWFQPRAKRWPMFCNIHHEQSRSFRYLTP